MIKFFSKMLSIIGLFLCTITLCIATTGCSLQDIFGGGYKSAYQVAVDNGYTGTEEEWLATFRDGNVGLSLYEEAVKKGYFTGTFEEFMQSVYAGKNSLTKATSLAMRSSVKIVGATAKGSGAIIAYDSSSQIAHIATPYHVVVDKYNSPTYACSSIKVYPYVEGKDITFSCDITTLAFDDVSFLGGSLYNDVAFLKVTIAQEEWEKYQLRVAEINTGDTNLGEDTILISNSNNAGLNANRVDISRQNLNKQTISGNNELVINNINGTTGTTHLHSFRVNALTSADGGYIQSESAKKLRSTNGVLYNVKGEIVGLMVAKSAEDEDERNFSYAIPSYNVKAIYTNVNSQITGSITWAMAKKYKLNLELETSHDYYMQVGESEENLGYVYPRDSVVVKGGLGALELLNKVLVSATIKRGGAVYQTKDINSIYALGELMWYAKSGDTVVIKYKNSSNLIAEEVISISSLSEINQAEWIETYSKNLAEC